MDRFVYNYDPKVDSVTSVVFLDQGPIRGFVKKVAKKEKLTSVKMKNERKRKLNHKKAEEEEENKRTSRDVKSEGKEEKNIYIFRGIPFAEPPINNLRFKRTQRITKETQTLMTERQLMLKEKISLTQMASKLRQEEEEAKKKTQPEKESGEDKTETIGEKLQEENRDSKPESGFHVVLECNVDGPNSPQFSLVSMLPLGLGLVIKNMVNGWKYWTSASYMRKVKTLQSLEKDKINEPNKIEKNDDKSGITNSSLDYPEKIVTTPSFIDRVRGIGMFNEDSTHILGSSEDCLYLNIETPYLPEPSRYSLNTERTTNFSSSHPSSGRLSLLQYKSRMGTTEEIKLRPVMVFIHGGAFRLGSGSEGLYRPTSCPLAQRDVVYVSFNYRLGVLGFLKVPGGDYNCGLYDQIEALLWIQENIHHFGGDKNNVTIFGESAGGMSVSLLTLACPNGYYINNEDSPIRLFHRIIAQSGTGCIGLSEEEGEDISKVFCHYLGLQYPKGEKDKMARERENQEEDLAQEISNDTKESDELGQGKDEEEYNITVLQEMPVDKLLDAQSKVVHAREVGFIPFQTVYDENLLKGKSRGCLINQWSKYGVCSDLDVMIGYTLSEQSFFTLLFPQHFRCFTAVELHEKITKSFDSFLGVNNSLLSAGTLNLASKDSKDHEDKNDGDRTLSNEESDNGKQGEEEVEQQEEDFAQKLASLERSKAIVRIVEELVASTYVEDINKHSQDYVMCSKAEEADWQKKTNLWIEKQQRIEKEKERKERNNGNSWNVLNFITDCFSNSGPPIHNDLQKEEEKESQSASVETSVGSISKFLLRFYPPVSPPKRDINDMSFAFPAYDKQFYTSRVILFASYLTFVIPSHLAVDALLTYHQLRLKSASIEHSTGNFTDGRTFSKVEEPIARNIYMYRFDIFAPFVGGSPHVIDLAYLFDLWPLFQFVKMTNDVPAEQHEYLSDCVATYWTNFAKTGNPNYDFSSDDDIQNDPQEQPFLSSERNTSLERHLQTEKDAAVLPFWEKIDMSDFNVTQSGENDEASKKNESDVKGSIHNTMLFNFPAFKSDHQSLLATEDRHESSERELEDLDLQNALRPHSNSSINEVNSTTIGMRSNKLNCRSILPTLYNVVEEHREKNSLTNHRSTWPQHLKDI